MAGLIRLIAVYLVGGVTFIPLVLLLLFLHAWLVLPRRTDTSSDTSDASKTSSSSHSSSSQKSPLLAQRTPSDKASATSRPDDLRQPNDDHRSLLSGPLALSEKFQGRHDTDVAEGYFAVCREYVPGGVNGKPPVRTTPAGEVIAGESPSVYQSMYRSLFERKQPNSIEATRSDNGNKPVRKARNVFFVVLRHGHLMLYDDAEQLEVRHVISLVHHDVSIYSGGNETPEGELWIKRNAIRLSRKPASTDRNAATTLPFYFFSENCSEKEDFYFALLRTQERTANDTNPVPRFADFETKDIIGLVQKLHSSEEQLQTRWLNAVIGRLFLSLYKTQEIEDIIRAKITKKIARVNKPAFVSSISIRHISLGDSAPSITNPKLRDLTVDGHCCIEMDVDYSGGFRIEIGTTIRIDMGARFKTREVDVVLAVVAKKLEGHFLIRFKPPPSNRIWMTFEKMPQLQLSIEPIVSTRQITYGVILRAIESKIRETLAETLVLPNWDDSPFHSTLGKQFRGGVWARETSKQAEELAPAIPDDTQPFPEGSSDASPASNGLAANYEERSASMPVLVDDASSESPAAAPLHKPRRSFTEKPANPERTSSSSLQASSDMPKVLRTQSFASSVADPVVNHDHANSKTDEPRQNTPRDAASFMAELSYRSPPLSPGDAPGNAIQDSRPSSMSSQKASEHRSSESSARNSIDPTLETSHGTLKSETKAATEGTRNRPEGRVEPGTPDSSSQKTAAAATRLQSLAKTVTPSEKRQQAFLSAATAAKSWSWNTINRKTKGGASGGEADQAGAPEQPLGRGRPLPPLGQPLPPPDNKHSIGTSLMMPKRKPVPATSAIPRSSENETPVHAPPRRKPQSIGGKPPGDNGTIAAQEILVVAAPAEPGLTHTPESSPDSYGEFLDNVAADDSEADLSAGANGAVSVPAEEDHTVEPTVPTGMPSKTGPDALSLTRNASPSRKLSFVDEDHGSATWRAAEEEQTRARHVWHDDGAHTEQ